METLSLYARVKKYFFVRKNSTEKSETQRINKAGAKSFSNRKAPSSKKHLYSTVSYDQPLVNTPFSSVRLFYYFLFAMLFLSIYLAYTILIPFLHTIIIACIFSALSHPLYKKLLPKLWNNEYLASAITLLLLVLIIGVPFVLFITQIVPEVVKSAQTIATYLGEGGLSSRAQEKLSPAITWLNTEYKWLDLKPDEISSALISLSSQIGQFFIWLGKSFFMTFATLAANFALMLLIMFFLLKEGEGMLKSLKKLTPLRDDQEDVILNNLKKTSRAVLLGGLSVAALQGIVGGIGLYIVGVPAFFWGTVMAMAALVPIIGTGLVWIPICIYFLIDGEPKSAIFLAGWCVVFVTSIDTFLRPIIMRGNSQVSLLFLFLTIFGGIKVFGALGMVYGPLIVTFLSVMIGIYSSEYGESLEKSVKNNSKKIPVPLGNSPKPHVRRLVKPPRRHKIAEQIERGE